MAPWGKINDDFAYCDTKMNNWLVIIKMICNDDDDINKHCLLATTRNEDTNIPQIHITRVSRLLVDLG